MNWRWKYKAGMNTTQILPANRATEKIYEDKLKLFYTQGNFTELWNFKKKLQLGDRGFFFKDMYKWGTRQIKLSGKGWAKRMIY